MRYESALQLRDFHVAISRPTHALLDRVKSVLVTAAVKHEPKLNHCFAKSSADRGVRLFDNAMAVVFMLYATDFFMLDERSKAEKCSFRNNDWLADNSVTVMEFTSFLPVMEYRMSQLKRALYQLTATWNSIVYDDKHLIEYLDLLSVRVGLFLVGTYTGIMHDVAAMRSRVTPLPTDGTAIEDESPESVEYQCSPQFLSLVAPVFGELFARILHVSRFYIAALPDAFAIPTTAHTTTEFLALPGWSAMTKLLGVWIRDKLAMMMPDTPSDYMDKYLYEGSLRPGERAVYIRESSATTSMQDVQYILGKHRNPEFLHLTETRRKTIEEVLTKELDVHLAELDSTAHLDGEEEGRYEQGDTLPFMLCLLELIDMHLRAMFHTNLAIGSLVILECELERRASDLDSDQHFPVMVQVFNYFQLYYGGRLYRFNSLLKSFVAWLVLVEGRLKRQFRKCDLTPWYAELLSPHHPEDGATLDNVLRGRDNNRAQSSQRQQQQQQQQRSKRTTLRLVAPSSNVVPTVL